MRKRAITSRRFAAAAVSALMLSGIGIAQVPQPSPPTETDLHAAYCGEVIKIEIGMLEKGLASWPNKEFMAPSAADSEALRAAKAKLAANWRGVKAGFESEKAILS
jgi:hypothetical protein